MRLLADSHILLAITRHEIAKYGSAIDLALQSPANDRFLSAASLWEIAIKYRIGKLELKLQLEKIPGYFASLGFQLLSIDHRHAIEDLQVSPATRDPFDRLLLAQCQVENLLLVTADAILQPHPLAWPAP